MRPRARCGPRGRGSEGNGRSINGNGRSTDEPRRSSDEPRRSTDETGRSTDEPRRSSDERRRSTDEPRRSSVALIKQAGGQLSELTIRDAVFEQADFPHTHITNVRFECCSFYDVSLADAIGTTSCLKTVSDILTRDADVHAFPRNPRSLRPGNIDRGDFTQRAQSTAKSAKNFDFFFAPFAPLCGLCAKSGATPGRCGQPG